MSDLLTDRFIDILAVVNAAGSQTLQILVVITLPLAVC